jgi:exodeoxyribonuclease VII small subunit
MNSKKRQTDGDPASTAGDAAGTGTGDFSAIAAMTFDTALDELESVVEKLESGDTPLEELVANFERGMHLYGRCVQVLRDVADRIEQLHDLGDERSTLEPFDDDTTGDDGDDEADDDDGTAGGGSGNGRAPADGTDGARYSDEDDED